MNKQLRQILTFLHQSEKLKTELRHSWLSDGRRESVAEHTWRMVLMAILLRPYLEERLDLEKVLTMIVIHDLGEIKAGDIPRMDKPDKKQRKLNEKKAVEEITKLLPPDLGEKIKNLWLETEERRSPEAKFVNALDKLEVLIQHNEADISTWSEEKKEFSFNLHSADTSVVGIPLMEVFNQLVYEETRGNLKEAGFDLEELEEECEQEHSKFFNS